MENNEFWKVRIKNCTCYYFNDIIELQHFNLDNSLIDQKSHKNILIWDISHEILIDPNPNPNRWIYSNLWWNSEAKLEGSAEGIGSKLC